MTGLPEPLIRRAKDTASQIARLLVGRTPDEIMLSLALASVAMAAHSANAAAFAADLAQVTDGLTQDVLAHEKRKARH